MVEIKTSLLDLEIEMIVGCKQQHPNALGYNMILHTDECSYNVDLLESYEILAEYNTKIGEEIKVIFLMPMGDFIYDIYKKLDNLDMTVITKFYDEDISEQFKFVVTNNLRGIIGTDILKTSREQLNKQEKVRVEGQCINRVVEALRNVSVDGVYNYTTVSNVIYGSIKEALGMITIDGTTPIVNIDMAPSPNERTYRHVQIPTGVSSLEVPSYLQMTDYGVYNGNIGTFVQKYSPNEEPPVDTIFVYPLYDYGIFDKVERKVLLYGDSKIKYKLVESTFKQDGDVLMILTSADTKVTYDGENEFMNEGSGIIITNPNNIIQRNNLTTNDEMHTDSNANMKGIILKDRVDGSNRTTYIGNTDNAYKARSMVIRRAMMEVQLQWHYCDTRLLYPGMPIMFIYEDNDDNIIRLNGTLQSMFMKYTEATKTSSAILNIVVIKPEIFGEDDDS